MSEMNLRSRQTASKPSVAESTDGDAAVAKSKAKAPESKRGIGILDIIRVLLGMLLLSTAVSYFIHGNVFWGVKRPVWTKWDRLQLLLQGEREMTPEELLKFDGSEDGTPIYIAINGVIYDVSASPQFYGPGGGYHIFAGRDSTRAFITGCFDDDWTSDLRGVEELYMPKDLDRAPKLSDEASDAEKKAARKLWKLRRDRASREGKAKARMTIDAWQSRFESGMGGKYFRVGTVKLPDDWKEQRGGIRDLCKNAQDSRPATNKWSTWNGIDDLTEDSKAKLPV